MGGEINFCLVREEVWLSLGAYFIHFPAPTRQVIIAQSLGLRVTWLIMMSLFHHKEKNKNKKKRERENC